MERCKQHLLLELGLVAEERFHQDAAPGSSSGSLRRPLHNIECSVCLESDVSSANAIWLMCDHAFCLPCLQQHVASRMSEGDSTSVRIKMMSSLSLSFCSFQLSLFLLRICHQDFCDGLRTYSAAAIILCPLAQKGSACAAGLSQHELRGILGPQAWAKLDRRALEYAVSVDPTLHLCASPDCPYVVSWAGPADGPPVLDCPVCHIRRCLICNTAPFHEGRACPEPSADAAAHASAVASVPGEVVLPSNIKRCRRCGAGIVKDVGCDKVKCRCGYRFCWICLSENAQCSCTHASHGFFDNVAGGADFSRLRDIASPT
jgi:hypothetical protein